MQIVVVTLGGEEVIQLDAQPSWTLDDVRLQISGGGDAEKAADSEEQPRRARIFFGHLELLPGATLADLGVEAESKLTLVLTSALKALPRSDDGSTEIWRAGEGEASIFSQFWIDHRNGHAIRRA
eukprot:TRINITY_DN15018_c0_g1_i1.p1 TRINITY_DN15018_c0_g1~~TRINITY_DN15018_c0_g1_i1.p1  ORF type:complete len:125 (+),score=22.01 TRINITY_DN15018_c0_g1_i1:91-465(+)